METKKKTAKKVTKKVVKKKVAKKKATKVKELTSKAKEKKLQKKLEAEFSEVVDIGALEVGITKDGGVIVKKIGASEEVNNILNEILEAYQARLMANQLAPIFKSPLFHNITRK